MTGPVLRRVEAGLYETPDGRYGVVRVESMDEWDAVESCGWAVTRGPAKSGEEIPGTECRTKAEATQRLTEILAGEAAS